MPQIFFTQTYLRSLERIEDHIFNTTQGLIYVKRFLEKHELALNFLMLNPHLPSYYPKTKNQSWIFQKGRYRIIYKHQKDALYLLVLLDNKMKKTSGTLFSLKLHEE